MLLLITDFVAELVMSGHSLGAAVAGLLALVCQLLFRDTPVE